jgi:RimJ/RimL family protein N-acetyltransferase
VAAGSPSTSSSVLCAYGFTVRGLHRLQFETLADNTSMIRAASRAGFVQEGTLRRAAWVNGEFVDEVIFGLLAENWNSGAHQRPEGARGICSRTRPAPTGL